MDPDKAWLSLLLIFRLAFRFFSVMDALGIVLFYNAPLLMELPLPRFTIPGYILLTGVLEVYLIMILRKGLLPVKLLFVYSIVALVFELPYAALSGTSMGLTLFVLPWYLSALVGFILVLKHVHSSLGRA